MDEDAGALVTGVEWSATMANGDGARLGTKGGGSDRDGYRRERRQGPGKMESYGEAVAGQVVHSECLGNGETCHGAKHGPLSAASRITPPNNSLICTALIGRRTRVRN